MSTNAGLATLFDGLVWVTRFARAQESMFERLDNTGYLGGYNVVFPGDVGGTWQLVFDGNAVVCRMGAHEEPKGTVTMELEEFFKLLAGHTTYTTAELTGRVRVTGDGHASFLFGALIAQLRHLRGRRSLVGWAVRWWTDRALRRSQTGFEFQR